MDDVKVASASASREQSVEVQADFGATRVAMSVALESADGLKKSELEAPRSPRMRNVRESVSKLGKYHLSDLNHHEDKTMETPLMDLSWGLKYKDVFNRNVCARICMLVMGLMYTFLTGIVLMWLLKDVVEGVRSEYKARVRDRYQGSVEIIDACLEIIENNIAKKRPTIDTMLTMPLPGAHYLKCKNAQLVPLQVPVLAILAVVLGVVVVIGPFWIRSDFLFEVKQNYGLVTVVFVICGFGAIVFGYVFGDVAIRVYSLYWVNYALMEAFCGAIYIKSADDIAAWSDLRKYFQYYEMLVNYQIGGKAFGVMILGLLFLSFYVLEDWVQTGGHIWRNTYSLSGVGALILIAAVLLMFSHAAASIYTVQRTQLSMLRQEQLRLKYLVTMKEKDEAAKCFELIEFLIQFIHDHDEKPRILGIEMTPTVLRVINGYIVTAVVAIIGNLITVA